MRVADYMIRHRGPDSLITGPSTANTRIDACGGMSIDVYPKNLKPFSGTVRCYVHWLST